MRQILLYGLILGLLLAFMQFIQYRLVFIQHAESVYTGLVALVCCIAGIWAGHKIASKWNPQSAEPAPLVPATAVPDEKVLARWNITPRELEVLQLIAQGLSNQEIAGRLFLSLWNPQSAEPAPLVPATAVPDEKVLARWNITPRELEVLQLIAQGLSNQEIAGRLFLSLNTVKTHTSNVFSKLDVQRRTQAIQKAKELGLLV